MKYYLLLIVLFISSANAQIDSLQILNARKFLYFSDSTSAPFIGYDTVAKKFKRPPIEWGLRYYVYDGVISSPLEHTTFFLLHGKNKSPQTYFVIASYKDTFAVITKQWCQEGYGCNSVIKFINERLIDEDVFNSQQLYELAIAIGNISVPAFAHYAIVSRSDEVWWRGDRYDDIIHLSDTMKNIVKPFSIEVFDDHLIAEYFVWNTVVLKKVTLSYRNRKIDIQIKQIGKFGKPIILM